MDWKQLGVGIQIVCLLALLYCVAIMVDNQLDEKICEKEFRALSNYSVSSSFANDDWDTLNFGRNIHCSVFFYQADNYLNRVDFLSGNLTFGKIDAVLY
jgi:hypothetical protein